MTKFTQDMALAQHVEAGGIRFAYRRLGVPERLPLVFFQHFIGTASRSACPERLPGEEGS
jgi:hypothetical protein